MSHTLKFEGHEFEVEFEPSCYHDAVVRFVDGKAVVGYISQDTDCESPLDSCDGMGKIIRKDHIDGKYDFREAFALDEYDNPAEEDDGTPKQGNHMAVPLYYVDQSYGQYKFRDINDGADSAWIPDDSCIEHIKSEAIKMLLPEGSKVEYKTTKLNPDGTVICLTRGKHKGKPDPRYFNVITWTLPDGRSSSGSNGGYTSFTQAYRAMAEAAGIDLTDKEEIKRGETLAASECAKGCVAEVNKWLEGDCYGVCHEVFKKNDEGEWEKDEDATEDHNACWGFIGAKYAIEEVTSLVNAQVRELTPPPSEQEVSEAAAMFAE